MLLSVSLLALLGASVAVNLPGVPTEFSATDAVLSAISDEIADKFAKEYLDFLKTGVESASLRQISAQLAQSHSKRDLFTKELSELGAADQFFACTTCRATARILVPKFREDNGEFNGENAEEVVKEIYMDICKRLDMQTEEVCSGVFDSHWLTMDYIIKNSVMDSRTFCSLFMEWNFCNVRNPDFNWTLTIDNSGPAVTGPKSDIPTKSADDLVVLHVSDIHHDPLYEVGALAECAEPQCCQRHKDTTEPGKAAGQWGDYRDCDAPWNMIENALTYIQKTHPKIDYIYQTGDVVDHMVWATSVVKNTGIMTNVSDKINELFPGVPVYSCIGNHEPHPLNVFSPSDVPGNINTRWLYEFLYNDWSKWLPESTKETILKGGYYTHSPKAGFRIIALNNNECYTSNWWLFNNGTASQPQLKWLHDTLLAAEKAEEHVHILAHIPTGDGTCWSTWAREYNRIIERFRNTISGIFNGHSHKDEMNVHYSQSGHAIGMAWNGGALTTYSNKNPNYVLYEVDPKSMQVVDFETWIFNLTAANANPTAEPEWHREYIFSEEFTEDLSPNGINKLLDSMADNPDLLRKFWRFKNTMADPMLAQGCDDGCLLGTICRLATTINNERTRCDELRAKLKTALDAEKPATEEPTSSSTSTPTTSSAGTTASTPSSTDSSSSSTPPTTQEPGGDGAGSMAAMKVTSMIGLFLAVKYFL